MQLWWQIRYRLKCLFRRSQLEAEMAEELNQHLELRTQAHLAAGFSAPEARALALRQFGGVERIKEDAREQRAFAWLVDAARDFGFGLRQLRRTPTMAVTAVLSLALGIGAATAMYSVTRGVLFRPLPFPHAEQLVTIRETCLPRFPQAGVSPGAFNLWRQDRARFERIAAWDYSYFLVAGLDHPQRRFALRVTAEFLAAYQVAPLLGRDFRPGDEAADANPVVIIGHALWLQQFAGRSDVVGRQISLDGRLHTIIGVAPRWFPPANYTVDLFVPRHFSPEERANFSDHDLDVVARLAPGVSLAAATASLADGARELAGQHPDTNGGWGVSVTSLQQDTTSAWRTELYTLLGAVGLLLLIACVNVANLLLARAYSRRRELAVRAALGAGRLRIFRQMISESLALALLGGVLGVALAYGGTRLLLLLAPNWLPRVGEITLDGPVMLFSALATLGTGLAFGLVPAVYACRVERTDGLKRALDLEPGPARKIRLIGALVVAEVALATSLLFAAALLVKSLQDLTRIDPGYRSADVYFTGFNLPSEHFAGRQQLAFVDSLTGLLRHQSGIEGVGVVSRPTAMAAASAGSELGQVAVSSATPGYFSAMGISQLAGRIFADASDPAAPLEIVVDTELARRLAPGGEAVGRRLRLEALPGRDAVVVGVVAHVRPGLGEDDPVPQAYLPFSATPVESFSLFVHSSRTQLDLTRTIRSAVAAVEGGLAVDRLHYLPSALHASLRIHRYVTALFVIFALLALMLSAAGVYGVMAYSVAQRTNEFGVRVALGAHRRDVILMVMREGAQLILLGLVCGGAGALGLSRLVSFVLFNVQPYDVSTLGIVTLLLGGIGLLACWGPAWRATTVEPVTALRLE